ncbi:MAG TPA: hypothetical protein VF618_19210 [Thermoanaerobaculia bacterium]
MKRLLILLVASLVPAAGAAALELILAPAGVRVEGATRGGNVALVAAAREESAPGLNTRMTQIAEVLQDHDGNGSVEYNLNRPLPAHSIWIAVDQRTGEFVTATPPTFGDRRMALPEGLVKNVPADDLDQIVSDRFVSGMLWVQPGNGGGVWTARTADGASNDEDGANDGKSVVSAAAFRALEGSDKAPKKLKTGDVVAVIDPYELRYAVVTVTKR